MKHRIIFLVTILTSILLTDFATARNSHHQTRMNPGKGGHAWNLTDCTAEQQEKIKEIDMKIEDRVLRLQSKLIVLYAELKKMMIDDNPNQSAVMKKAETIGSIQIDIQKLRLEQQLKIRALLTPEQRIRFDRHLLESHDRLSGFHGMKGKPHFRQARKPCTPMMMDADEGAAGSEQKKKQE
ncbi:Spy/CpxP family protein refolding chaperone [bacterium]|nr:Spy/CpxP family protein refolding chaperone [bacterium]